MKILSWNVNGIRSVDRKGIITKWIQKQDADIINLQEIKAQTDQIPMFLLNIPGYKTYINSGERKGYSGVLTYTKIQPNKENKSLGHKRFDSEGRMLWLEFDKFILLNLYVPNGGRDKSNLEYKMDFYDTLITKLKQKHKDIIMVGDFNIAHKEIDLARPDQNKNSIMFTPREREKFEKLLNIGFSDSFRLLHKEGGLYSWWAYFRGARERNVGWRIDYTLVSNNISNKVKEAFIQKEVLGSDHCPVGIDIDL